MEISRRTFLKISGATTGGAVLARLGFGLRPVKAYAQPLKVKYARETTTICPYCAVGCGEIVATHKGKVINVEGDPDHPINRGSLCSKGSALYQVVNNNRRLSKVLYRAPQAREWREVSWDWALDRIAANIKKTRDGSFVKKDAKGNVVNRTEGIAALGGAALDNEECYLYSKMARALGIVYLEHQARI